jgi:hypothetical protein
MPTVTKDDEEEDDNEEPNENKVPADNVIYEVDEHHQTISIKVMTASEKLSSACPPYTSTATLRHSVFSWYPVFWSTTSGSTHSITANVVLDI